MLPFLKQRPASVAGVIVKNREPDEKPDSMEQEEMSLNDLEVCAEDILHAINMKDIKGLASALQAAFEVMEASPHEEGPHTNDFHSQNIKAAKNSEE